MAQIISNENLRRLCIQNNWFTEGSNTQYEKLFHANSSGCSLEELVTIIWLCSDAKLHCRRDIKSAIIAECNIDVISNATQIIEFTKIKIPTDWNSQNIQERQQYWAKTLITGNDENLILIDRKRISAVEIWCELFNGDRECMRPSDARKINAIIAEQSDWGDTTTPMRFGPYGVQRGFTRSGK